MNEANGPRNPGPDASANVAPKPQEMSMQELLTENARLKAEVAQVSLERDEYLNRLYRLFPEYVFTEADILDLLKNGVSGREILADLEGLAKGNP